LAFQNFARQMKLTSAKLLAAATNGLEAWRTQMTLQQPHTRTQDKLYACASQLDTRRRYVKKKIRHEQEKHSSALPDGAEVISIDDD
jgi:hypothetical protein